MFKNGIGMATQLGMLQGEGNKNIANSFGQDVLDTQFTWVDRESLDRLLSLTACSAAAARDLLWCHVI